MEKVIMWILAVSALLGGLDHLIGDKFGLGKKFEEGFMMLGTTALSMVGVICIVPVLAVGLEKFVSPLYQSIGLDPGMIGGIIALDMGGYQLSQALSRTPEIASYAGIIVGATLGCTVVFTIPVGMGGVVPKEHQPDFARGILFGLIGLPVSLVLGSLLSGLSIAQMIWQNIPVLILSLLFIVGIAKIPEKMVRGFRVLAKVIGWLTTAGLALAAFQYMSGVTLVPGLGKIEDAMVVVSAVGIVLLGSLPATQILQWILKKPLAWLGEKCGMSSTSVAGLLISAVNVLAGIILIKDMDKRGRIVNAAAMVCSASAISTHLGFTFGVEPGMIGAMLISKLLGGAAGAIIALLATRKLKQETA